MQAKKETDADVLMDEKTGQDAGQEGRKNLNCP